MLIMVSITLLKEMSAMLINQICSLRDKLNKSVLTEDYENTYKLSIELDELIARYYRENLSSDEVENYKGKMNTNIVAE